jgi:hypothetical protein
MRRQHNYLKKEQTRLMHELPLSNFGPGRVPKHLTPQIIVSQAKKRTIQRNKKQQQEHILLKQFTARGVFKNRYFDLDLECPLSLLDHKQDSANGSDPQSDATLQEFLGYESDQESDVLIEKEGESQDEFQEAHENNSSDSPHWEQDKELDEGFIITETSEKHYLNRSPPQLLETVASV